MSASAWRRSAAPKAEIDRRVDEALALVRLDRAGGQAARPDLRRAAAARGDRARHRGRAAAGADGRAAVQPRRQAAAGDAGGDPAHPHDARLRHDLRHARPGRGAVARRPHRGDARRAACARSARRRMLYARPCTADVAEFMGYRNLVPSTARGRRQRCCRSASAVRRLMGVPVDAGPGTGDGGDPAGGSARRAPDAPIAAHGRGRRISRPRLLRLRPRAGRRRRCSSDPRRGWCPAKPSGWVRHPSACWSMPRPTRHERARDHLAADATEAARTGWRDAAGVARRARRAGAVHLPVPLRAVPVLHAEEGRLVRQLRDVLQQPVPVRHDLYDAADRGAGDAGERGVLHPRGPARPADAAASGC